MNFTAASPENKKEKRGLFVKYDGGWLKDKLNGYGTMKYSNGDTYVGEFVRGKFSGLGKYTFYGGGFDNGIWEKGELIERLEEGATVPEKDSEKKEVQIKWESLLHYVKLPHLL